MPETTFYDTLKLEFYVIYSFDIMKTESVDSNHHSLNDGIVLKVMINSITITWRAIGRMESIGNIALN
jgi:hypothetical protein